MRLVPRQLQRVGMTGSVPYYGGRLTPAQAYAASHPTQADTTAPAAPTPPAPAPRPTRPRLSRDEQFAALQDLRDSGLLTDDELASLRARAEQ